MADKKYVPIIDFVDGIDGTLVEITDEREDGRKLKSDVEGLDDVVQIKYYPSVDLSDAPLKWLKLQLGLADPKRSPSIYPRSAVEKVPVVNGHEDTPDQYCVIFEDQHENKNLAQRIGKFQESNLARLQKKADVKETEANVEKLENVTEEDDDDSMKRNRRGPRPEDRVGETFDSYRDGGRQ